MEETKTYGTVRTSLGEEINIIDFVITEFVDGRHISISTLENNKGFILNVENPPSSGRTNQKMWLSEESFYGLYSTYAVYSQCKGVNLIDKLERAAPNNINYSFSDNLSEIKQ